MDFISGEILLVDKPYEWSSFAVVNKLRYEIRKKLGVKKIKVGHAGTLDPLATGLLILCTGKKTKEIEQYMTDEKTYTGTIRFGSTTPSYDLETAPGGFVPTEGFDPSQLEAIIPDFLGEQEQTPPIFSAKKIDGKRAYEHARKGRDIEMRKSLITIHSLSLDYSDFPDVTFETACSKGTYIRSLAHDLGVAAGIGGHLTALRRTRSGTFSIENARTVEAWVELIRAL